MKIGVSMLMLRVLMIIILAYSLQAGILRDETKGSSLESILPDLDSWETTESPQRYFPETLFEYIDGAAEIYLSYEFKELIVAQYKKDNSEANMSVEIYDMGDEINSFGIYSAERFPESHFISVGIQGYLDEGSLNFFAGSYYVKLLCFGCGEESDAILKLFSWDIAGRVKDRGHFPQILSAFPGEGLIPNSEKFILRNFLGYGFLKNGYLANYKIEDMEFDCFLIVGENSEDAQNMLQRYLEAKDKESVRHIRLGYLLKDRYYDNIYLARVENYLCGVMKIKDHFKEVGEKYLKMLAENLKKE